MPADHALPSPPTTVVGPVDAPVCVLLHGLGTTGWMWRGLVDRLDDRLRVVVVDLPGHGSDAATPWVSLAQTVEGLHRTLREVAPAGGAHLVGLSLGGYVALEAAAALPGTVASAMVSGVNVLPFPRPRLVRAAGRAMAPFMTSRAVLGANARALSVPPEDREGFAAAARSVARGTFAGVGDELLRYRLPTAADACPARVLAVAGSAEHPLVLRSLPDIASAFPHGDARTAPRAGHAWSGQHPDLFARTVLAHVGARELPAELGRVA